MANVVIYRYVCYSYITIEMFYSFSIFLILILFATNLVFLLIKYENNGFLCIAELGHQYRLLLK